MDLLTIICLNYPTNLNGLISVAADAFTEESIVYMQVLNHDASRTRTLELESSWLFLLDPVLFLL